MQARFDLYVRRNTWLHRLDPRIKALFVLEASLLLFIWPSVWMALATVLLCLLILWSAQIPSGRVARVWRMMAPLLILVFVLTALFGGKGGATWLTLGPLAVTGGSVRWGAVLALRLLALALIIFIWLFTTDQATMVRGFRALRVPYAWALTLALALRYLPVFAGLYDHVRDAQQARGLDLEQRGFWQRLRSYRPVLVVMVILALRQSEQLGWALEARALGAHEVPRSVFRPLQLRRVDRLVLAGLLAGLAAAMAVHFWLKV